MSAVEGMRFWWIVRGSWWGGWRWVFYSPSINFPECGFSLSFHLFKTVFRFHQLPVLEQGFFGGFRPIFSGSLISAGRQSMPSSPIIATTLLVQMQARNLGKELGQTQALPRFPFHLSLLSLMLYFWNPWCCSGDVHLNLSSRALTHSSENSPPRPFPRRSRRIPRPSCAFPARWSREGGVGGCDTGLG